VICVTRRPWSLAALALFEAACDAGDEGAPVDDVRGEALVTASPQWSELGGQGGAEFGQQVRSAGDVNGDGYDDLAVGA